MKHNDRSVQETYLLNYSQILKQTGKSDYFQQTGSFKEFQWTNSSSFTYTQLSNAPNNDVKFYMSKVYEVK